MTTICLIMLACNRCTQLLKGKRYDWEWKSDGQTAKESESRNYQHREAQWQLQCAIHYLIHPIGLINENHA
jgi:hypothetical protein